MGTSEGMHPDSVVVAAGRPARRPGAPLSAPVTLSAMYVAGADVAYARVGNPTWSAFEEAVGALEGGSALVFASGQAAIAAVVDDLPAGAVVVAPADSYSGTRAFLADAEAHGRLAVRLVDISDSDVTVAACRGADLVFIESPTNPLLTVADLPTVIAGAHAAGARVAVDNTFATPLLQRPLELGADIVVHSATKFLSGHSDLIMGVTVTRDQTTLQRLATRRSLSGAIAGPVETFLALRGLRTLAIRLERAQANAARIAVRLGDHPAVARVRYPGYGAIVSFEVAAGADAAEKVCTSAVLITHATSLGGVETTMERRRRHPGEDLVPDELVRISVGIEHVDDLWADLQQALDGIGVRR